MSNRTQVKEVKADAESYGTKAVKSLLEKMEKYEQKKIDKFEFDKAMVRFLVTVGVSFENIQKVLDLAHPEETPKARKTLPQVQEILAGSKHFMSDGEVRE